MCSTYTSKTSSLVCTLSGRLAHKMKWRQPHPGAQLTSDERQLSGTMFWRIFHICLCLGHRWTLTPLGCHQRFPRLSLSWSSMDADSTGMSSTFFHVCLCLGHRWALTPLGCHQRFPWQAAPSPALWRRPPYFLLKKMTFFNFIKNIVAVAAYVRLASWSQAKFQEINEKETFPASVRRHLCISRHPLICSIYLAKWEKRLVIC